MANLVPAVAGGNWSAAASWIDVATGLAPAAAPAIGTDDCYLGSSGTNPTITNIAGAASGANSVTLTFTGTARAGMAFKIAGTTGVYILLAQATSGAAVEIVPVLEGAVTAASAVTPFNCGNITVDNTTATCGTAKAITSAGGGGSLIVGRGATLSHAKNVNTKLVVRGSIFVCPGGVYDCGTDAAPIQSAYTAEIQTNALASPTAGAHCFKIARASSNGRVSNGDGTLVTFVHANQPVRNRKLNADVAASATTATINDSTGWSVGDSVVFMATRTTNAGAGTNADVEIKALTTCSAGSLGWTGGLVGPHLTGGHVGLITAGIYFNGQAVNANQGCSIHADAAGACNNEFLIIKGARFDGSRPWTGDASFQGAVVVSYTSNVNATTKNLTIASVAFGNCNSRGVTIAGGRVKANTVDNCVFHVLGNNQAIYESNTCGGTLFTDLSFYLGGPILLPTFGYGTSGNTFTRCVFSPGNNGSHIFQATAGAGQAFVDCYFGVAQYWLGMDTVASASFLRCYFGVAHPTVGGWAQASLAGGGTPFNTPVYGALANYTFTDCYWAADPTISSRTNMNTDSSKNTLLFINYGSDSTDQRAKIYNANIYRDNSQLIRSRSSVRIEPIVANSAATQTYRAAAASSVATTFRFGLRYDTTYGTGTPPSVTVSGLGITPQVFTAGGSANTDYNGTITVTPTSTGNLTITVSGQSTATTGKFWFSGMSVSPWVDWTQHYGYAYAPASPTLTVDPVVQLSESAAGALSGLSYGSGTLTVTGSRSDREIYDWMKWYEAANRLDPIITSSDGINFALAANLAVTGGTITGTGVLTLAAGKTYAFTAGGVSQIKVISDAATTTYLTLTGLAGHAVYLADNASAQVDWQTSVTGTYAYFSSSATGAWSWRTKKYGQLPSSGAFSAATGPVTAAPTQTNDTSITQATAATVAAYTTLENWDKVYDYCQYFITQTGTGQGLGQIVTKNGSAVDLGAYNLTVDATAGSVFALSGGITIKATNLVAGTTFQGMSTTGTISTANGALVDTWYTTAAGRSVLVLAPSIISGSRFQLWNSTGSAEIANDVCGSGGIYYRLIWTADITLRMRATYQSGAVAKHEVEVSSVLTNTGTTFLDTQEDEDAYNQNGIDGSTCTEFSDDYPNVQIDINDPDGTTSVQRLYAWYHYTITTANGIRNFFRAMDASDTANYEIDQSVVDLKLDNTSASPVVVNGGYLRRRDETTVIAATSGSIQMDPLKAYVAGIGSVAAAVWGAASRTLTGTTDANIVQVNGYTISGSGTQVDPWGPI